MGLHDAQLLPTTGLPRRCLGSERPLVPVVPSSLYLQLCFVCPLRICIRSLSMGVSGRQGPFFQGPPRPPRPIIFSLETPSPQQQPQAKVLWLEGGRREHRGPRGSLQTALHGNPNCFVFASTCAHAGRSFEHPELWLCYPVLGARAGAPEMLSSLLNVAQRASNLLHTQP